MAVMDICSIHGNTPHSSGGQCIRCSNEVEAIELKKWEKKTTKEKLRDLDSRVRMLEKGHSKY